MPNQREPYCIVLENEQTIIESNLDIAIAKAQARTAKPIAAGWLCTYGCGRLHGMRTQEEYDKVVAAFPDRFHKIDESENA